MSRADAACQGVEDLRDRLSVYEPGGVTIEVGKLAVKLGLDSEKPARRG